MRTLITILALLMITFFSCQSNLKFRKDVKALRENMKVHIKGFVNNEYVFSDKSIRNLKVFFVNDSLLEISNTSFSTYYDQHYIDFKCRYIYKSISLTQLIILKPLLGCRLPQNPQIHYLKPYDPAHFTIDWNAIHYIFPNIAKDTIRFSADLERLQIREFCFDKRKTKR